MLYSQKFEATLYTDIRCAALWSDWQIQKNTNLCESLQKLKHEEQEARRDQGNEDFVLTGGRIKEGSSYLDISEVPPYIYVHSTLILCKAENSR